ncbi:unnamed protein product [Absidia cylindrospora]
MSSGTHLFKSSMSNDIKLQSTEYSISVLQQPSRVRVSTHKEKGRKSLDPPPIIQLHLPQRSEQETLNILQTPCLFMCANLAHPQDDNEVYTPSHNALSGQVVSSLYKMKNEQKEDGGYFLFGDLSVKVNGVFRLKMSLFEVTGEGTVYKSSIFSEPFTAYSARSYPGALDPTLLSRLFYVQGARLRLPKDYGNATGSSQSEKTRKRKLDDEESVDSENGQPHISVSTKQTQPPPHLHQHGYNYPYCSDQQDHQPYQYTLDQQYQHTLDQHGQPNPHNYHHTYTATMERRQSLTSTEDGGSPQSIHTPLSPLQELLPFSTQTHPMIRLPPLKFNIPNHASPWQHDNDDNSDRPIYLPPLHSLVP